MTEDQEKAVQLLKQGFELAEKSDLNITCSVDISTGDHDAGARCFGEFEEINSWPSDDGFGSREVQMLFAGSLNYEAVKGALGDKQK